MSTTSVFKMGFLSMIAATGLFVVANGFAAETHTTSTGEGGKAKAVSDEVKIPETPLPHGQVVDSKGSQSGERIGGQAGRGYDRGYDQTKRESVAVQAGERIGGQAGWGYDQGYDQTKRESVAAQAGERIGGQAGRGYDQDKLQRVAAR
jgi:hypothetical protein